MNLKNHILLAILVIMTTINNTQAGKITSNNNDGTCTVGNQKFRELTPDEIKEQKEKENARDKIQAEINEYIKLQQTTNKDEWETKYRETVNALERQLEDKKKEIQKFEDRMEFAKKIYQQCLDMEKCNFPDKTAIASAYVSKQAEQEGSLNRTKAILEKILDPQTFKRVASFVPLLTLGGVGMYYLCKFLYKYSTSLLGMPTLVRDSSRQSLLASLLKGNDEEQRKQELDNLFNDIILPEHTEQAVNSIVQATTQTHEKGLPYRHLVLYGQPGTGKTLIAQKLAHLSGMDYAIVSGADFLQFKPGVDIQKMHELFDWANNGKRGLILFIDEADALLRDRKTLNDQGVALVNSFLARTNASSDKFMLILATNYPNNLDSAVLSRISKKLEIPLPGQAERIRLFERYFKKHIEDTQDNVKLIIDTPFTHERIATIAQKIEGFSGREIEQLLAEIRIESMIANNNHVSYQLVNRITEDKTEQHRKEQEWLQQQMIQQK